MPGRSALGLNNRKATNLAHAILSCATLSLLGGDFVATGQVSPCSSAAGQLPSTNVSSGTPPVFYRSVDLSAGGGSNYFNINTDGHGNPIGSATVTFQSPGMICLGPGFQA